jgi:hypothetical protein
MMGVQETQARLFYDFCLDEHVPSSSAQGRRPPPRLADLRQSLKPFYSSMGRPSIDPELMMRMLIVGSFPAVRSRTSAFRPGYAAMLAALADPATSAEPEMPPWLGEEIDSPPPSPRQTRAPSVLFDLPEKLSTPIMQNREAGIASPQVAATVQSNHQYHQKSEIVQHRPGVTQRQFWQGHRRRNVREEHPRRQRTLAP